MGPSIGPNQLAEMRSAPKETRKVRDEPFFSPDTCQRIAASALEEQAPRNTSLDCMQAIIRRAGNQAMATD